MCHGDNTTGEPIPVDDQTKFLVRRNNRHIQGYLM